MHFTGLFISRGGAIRFSAINPLRLPLLLLGLCAAFHGARGADPAYEKPQPEPQATYRSFKSTDAKALAQLDPEFVFPTDKNKGVYGVVVDDRIVGYFIGDYRSRPMNITRVHYLPDHEPNFMWALGHHLTQSHLGESVTATLPAGERDLVRALRGHGFSYDAEASGNGKVGLRIDAIPASSIQVRWLIRRDMDAVAAREKAVHGKNGMTEEQLLALLRQRNVIGMVIEDSTGIKGHVIYALEKDRITVKTLALADSRFQGQYLSRIIDRLKSKLSQQRRQEIVVEEGAVSAVTGAALAWKDFVPTRRPDAHGVEKSVSVFHLNHLNAEVVAGQTHFARLGVDANASDYEISKAHGKIAAENSDGKVLSLLAEAKATLTNPTARAEYMRSHAAELRAVPRLFSSRMSDPKSQSLYDSLGLEPNANAEALERAKLNAEIVYGSNAHVDHAYRVLSQPELRAVYDAIDTSTEGKDKTEALSRFNQQVAAGEAPQLPAVRGVPRKRVRGTGHDEVVGTSVTEVKPASENFYQRLGVGENATQDTITNAYIDARLKFKGKKAKSDLIDEAYRVLRWPHLRREYDALLQSPSADTEKKLAKLLKGSPAVGQDIKVTGPLRNQTQLATVKPNDLSLYQRLGVGANVAREALVMARTEALAKKRLSADDRAEIEKAFRILYQPLLREAYDLLYYELREEGPALKKAIETLNTGKPDVVINLVKSEVHDHHDRTDLLDKLDQVGKAEPVLEPVVPNLYVKVGVSENASVEQIRQARAALTDPHKRRELENAFAILTNRRLRRGYDKLRTSPQAYVEEGKAAFGKLERQAANGLASNKLNELIESPLSANELFEAGQPLEGGIAQSEASRRYLAELANRLVAELKASHDLSSAIAKNRPALDWIMARHKVAQDGKGGEHSEWYRNTVDAAYTSLLDTVKQSVKTNQDRVAVARLFSWRDEAPVNAEAQKPGEVAGLYDVGYLREVSGQARNKLLGFGYGGDEAMEFLRELRYFATHGLADGSDLKDYIELATVMNELYRGVQGRVHPTFESKKELILEARLALAQGLADRFGKTRWTLGKVKSLFGRLDRWDPLDKFFWETQAKRPGAVAATVDVLGTFLRWCGGGSKAK